MSCVFCGASANIPVVFKDTFTAYQLLQAGDKACSRCAEMLRDAKFRRNCWYMQGEEWHKIENSMVLEFLEVTLPTLELPVIMYFTKQWKKHGWIIAVNNPVLCHSRFNIIVDEDKIQNVERKKFTEYLDLLGSFRSRGVPRFILTHGCPSPSSTLKYQITREECQRLAELEGDTMWNFIVAFKKRDEKNGKQR